MLLRWCWLFCQGLQLELLQNGNFRLSVIVKLFESTCVLLWSFWWVAPCCFQLPRCRLHIDLPWWPCRGNRGWNWRTQTSPYWVLVLMYDLLKTDAKDTISEELVNYWRSINASLAEQRVLTVRQPIAGKQYIHDRCKFQRIRLRTDDWRERRRGNTLQVEDIRISSVWITRIFAVLTENVNILQRILSNLISLPWI